MRRVAVTGYGAVSPIGDSWDEVRARLEAGENAVQHMDEWIEYKGLNTHLAAPAQHFVQPAHLTRKQTRTMGRVSLMAVAASEAALERAGLSGDPVLGSGRTGVAYGSSTGSTDAMRDFLSMLTNKSTAGINATTYVRMMSHTAAVNIGMLLGLQGRVLPTSSACTSGSQAIGAAFESIRAGHQTVMLAGGAEELCPTEAVVFDALYATSTCNDRPASTPRPFDQARDGLVIGEGACTLVLEDMEHARERGASVMAEIAGYATNSDGAHVTRPNQDTMRDCMALALTNAGVESAEVGYVCAHATATEHGDIAESHATGAVFGLKTPVSSLKSYVGHMLGACGSLEAWLTIEMMNAGWFAPTLNLTTVDPRCAPLDYIMGEGRHLTTSIAVSNNFAFGGINTSLVIRRTE